MGFTVPLDKDVLCFPAVGGYIGTVTEDSTTDDKLVVRRHHVKKDAESFGVTMELERCGGKVEQRGGFISLPDGRSVYMEQRKALQELFIVSAESGNVCIYDDTRWPFQKEPRVFCSEEGILNTQPGAKINGTGTWLNIDNRMGYAVLGSHGFTMTQSLEYYHTWSVSFVSAASETLPLQIPSGEQINCFAMISCPGQSSDDTACTAAELLKKGWLIQKDRVLAIHVSPYLVYVNFADEPADIEAGNKTVELASRSGGFIPYKNTDSE